MEVRPSQHATVDAVSEILISRRGEPIEQIEVALEDGKLHFEVQTREMLAT